MSKFQNIHIRLMVADVDNLHIHVFPAWLPRRKLKPYRMLWWVASTASHILVLALVLASTTTFSYSYLHIDHASHVKPVVFLSLITAILAIFEVGIIHCCLVFHRIAGFGYLCSFPDLYGKKPVRSSPRAHSVLWLDHLLAGKVAFLLLQDDPYWPGPAPPLLRTQMSFLLLLLPRKVLLSMKTWPSNSYLSNIQN